MRYILLVLAWGCGALTLSAQQQMRPAPTSWEGRMALERLMGDSIHNYFTGIQPMNMFETSPLENQRIDSLKYSGRFFNDNWLGRSLFNGSPLNINGEKYQITVNPILTLTLGKDFEDDTDAQTLYQNTRGIQLYGRIGEHFTYYSDVLENLVKMPDYVNEWIRGNRPFVGIGILPGQGIPKLVNGVEELDYGYVNGRMAYQPNEFFHFELGYGKNSIGDGYRSLLLSDNAFNYPYFKIHTSFWKIRYTNIFTQMRDLSQSYPDGDYLRKYTTMHYLSANVTRKLNVGIFEAVTYADSTGTRGYDLNYLNPVIFYRPIEFAIGSGSGNVLLGLTLKYQVNPELLFFGQFVMDEFKFQEVKKGDGWRGSKFGIQVGGRVHDPFKIKGLTVHSEVNAIRPYTYAHKRPIQNYSHYGQALAHPLGANFVESTTYISYTKNRWYAHLQFTLQNKGLDTLGLNYGGNIFQSNYHYPNEYGNDIGQGLNTSTTIADFRAGYVVNPTYNLSVELGYRYRKSSPDANAEGIEAHSTGYFHFGVRTTLYNHYYDF